MWAKKRGRKPKVAQVEDISLSQIASNFSNVESSIYPKTTYFLRSSNIPIKLHSSPYRHSTPKTISKTPSKWIVRSTRKHTKSKQIKSKPKLKSKTTSSIKVTSKSSSKKQKKYTMMTSRTLIQNADCPLFLENKCPNLFCDKIHNYTKIYQLSNNLKFKDNFDLIQSDFSLLQPYQQKIGAKQTLDICFIVDCTGSMYSWIQAVKQELYNIIDYIQTNNPGANTKISFLGYRDIKDSIRFEIKDFESNIHSIEEFIKNIHAFGGADLPEDLTGALKKALDLSWRENAAKYCVFITDAPCHGEKYHENIHDQYKNGDPSSLNPETFIEKIAKKEITLYAVKIHKDTDKMYKIFNDVYISHSKMNAPIIISDLGKSTDQLGFMVAVSSNTALNQLTVDHISLNSLLQQLEKDKKENQSYALAINNFITRIKTSVSVLKTQPMNGVDIKRNKFPVDTSRTLAKFLTENTKKKGLKAVCHSFIIKKDRYLNINWKTPYISHYEVETEIIVDSKPFNEGAERYAFYMKDNSIQSMDFVGKLYKTSSSSMNTIGHLSKELEAWTICHHLANEFNERVVNYLPKDKTNILINFINCYIYEISDPHTDNSWYMVENYIPGKYVKYNNNAGWISDSIADQTWLAQAFSHFSYQFTQGFLIVVDLQGVGGYWTDPQLHCLDPDKFGQGNWGYVGIVRFFLTHRCNKYCKNLGWMHPLGSKEKIDVDRYEFFVDKFIEPTNKDELVYKWCDWCMKPFLKKSGEVFEIKKKCWDCFCESCDAERKKTFKGSKCERCKKFFMSSAYYSKMKRMPFPDKCMKCRQEDINETREKYMKEVFDKVVIK